MPYRLLIIDDDAAGAGPLGAFGDDAEFRSQRLAWNSLDRERLACERTDGIVAVAVPDGARTIERFERFRAMATAKPTLVVLPDAASDALTDAVSQAAGDFLYLPIRLDEMRHRLCRLLGPPRDEIDAVRERLLEEIAMTQLVGRDPAFLAAIQQLPRFARSGMPVLITGETGTGKELCARALHHLGPRRSFPFVAVECGALPDHLVENELFGHARGAYTDAHRDQRGLIALAEGGTLFLDEIDALSLAAQGKLLRFLQERTYRPLGAEKFERADVNVVAATNRDLEACVREKQFRSDLYFRLHVLHLQLTPLRERASDVAVLSAHFLDELRLSGATSCRSLSLGALRKLTAYEWPGNVRELASVVKRAAILADTPQILAHQIGIADRAVPSAEGPATYRAARAHALAAFERHYLEELLRRHNGNVTHAAREAHKDRRVLGRLLKKHGFDRRAFRA